MDDVPLANMSAVVVGATGAVGRRVMARLLADTRFNKVIAITRIEFDFSKDSTAGAQLDKLETKIVPDLLTLSDQKDLMEGADVAFCTLGTTRSKAGSAQRFVEIDRDMVAAFAAGAKSTTSVKHFSLCTAAGSRSWASFPRGLVTAIHPLLYSHTKFEAEKAVIEAQFTTASIFQPGLLDRRMPGTEIRGLESVGLWLGKLSGATEVDVVAGAMIADAVAALRPTEQQQADKECVNYFSTSQIKALGTQQQ
eukprot:m.149108 g.149108  ORF g.149108 m.149108 type:complete len:252 (+) comp30638_c0_seq1:224-979(+)